MSDQETSKIKIHTTLVEKINFACHQSAFAVLRELQIENLDGERELSDLSLLSIYGTEALGAGGETHLCDIGHAAGGAYDTVDI
jgi:hypothetical protein